MAKAPTTTKARAKANDKLRDQAREAERKAAATQTDPVTGEGKEGSIEEPEVGTTSGDIGSVDAPKKKRTAHDVSDKETGLAAEFHSRMDEEMAADMPVGIHETARLRAEQDPANASEEDRRRLALSKELGVNVFPRDADEVDLPAKAE